LASDGDTAAIGELDDGVRIESGDDVTGSQGRVLRLGALSLEQLNAVLEPLGATLTDEA